MKGNLVIITLLLFSVVGCVQRNIPLATSYPITTQPKMQAAHHWEVLADHVAGRLAETLDLTFPNAVVKPALFLRYTQEHEKIPFGKAFFHLLTSRLVEKGLVVVNSAEYSNVLILDYDMQVIHHKDRRKFYPPPGTYTGMGSLFWLVAHGVDSWGERGLAVLPLGIGADIYSAVEHFLPGETNSEVIITTTVTMGQQTIFGSTNIYYINTRDDDHYENQTKTYQVVGCPQHNLCRY